MVRCLTHTARMRRRHLCIRILPHVSIEVVHGQKRVYVVRRLCIRARERVRCVKSPAVSSASYLLKQLSDGIWIVSCLSLLKQQLGGAVGRGVAVTEAEGA